MSPGPSLERDSLILIHAPVGRDAHLLHDLLHRAKLQSQVCLNIEQLCDEVEKGAGAIFVTEEGLEANGVESLASVLQKLGLDVTAPRFAPDVWLSYMGRDKKNEAGRITLILLDALGRGAIVKDTPPEDLRAFLSAT